MLFGESFCFSSASMTYVLRRAKQSCCVGPFELLFRHFFAHNFKKTDSLHFCPQTRRNENSRNCVFRTDRCRKKAKFRRSLHAKLFGTPFVWLLVEDTTEAAQSIEQNSTFNEEIEKKIHTQI